MRYRPSDLGTTRFFKCGESFVAFDLPTTWGGRPGRGVAASPVRAAAPLLKCAPDCISWAAHGVQTIYRPAVQGHHRPPEAACERDLAQGAPTLADGDHAFGSGHDQDVAGLAHPRRQ